MPRKISSVFAEYKLRDKASVALRKVEGASKKAFSGLKRTEKQTEELNKDLKKGEKQAKSFGDALRRVGGIGRRGARGVGTGVRGVGGAVTGGGLGAIGSAISPALFGAGAAVGVPLIALQRSVQRFETSLDPAINTLDEMAKLRRNFTSFGNLLRKAQAAGFGQADTTRGLNFLFKRIGLDEQTVKEVLPDLTKIIRAKFGEGVGLVEGTQRLLSGDIQRGEGIVTQRQAHFLQSQVPGVLEAARAGDDRFFKEFIKTLARLTIARETPETRQARARARFREKERDVEISRAFEATTRGRREAFKVSKGVQRGFENLQDSFAEGVGKGLERTKGIRRTIKKRTGLDLDIKTVGQTQSAFQGLRTGRGVAPPAKERPTVINQSNTIVIKDSANPNITGQMVVKALDEISKRRLPNEANLPIRQ